MRYLALLSLLTACAVDDPEVADVSASATDTAPLAWVGDTHLRVAGVWLPPTLAPASGRALEVYTQTYPIGAAASVELWWADASYTEVGSATMVLDADNVGATGNNSQWRALIPASALAADAATHYWIRAQDFAGNVVWDSRDGANYEVVPRHYQAQWIGGLGSYRPVNGDYLVGGLFNGDGSTSTGCWNHGVSASSYRSRAARVWIPGLSDRELDGAELAAAAAMVRFELYTDARSDGWGGAPATLVRREGNDFLYQFQFVRFIPPCIEGTGGGTYEYKLRASVDDGATWLWRGADDGSNLRVQYHPRCSYFNDPYDCIPTETELTRSIEGGWVQRWIATPLGATSTFTRELTGSTRTVWVTDIELVGADADQFELEVYDVGAGEYVDPAGPFELGAGDQLRLILVHAPTVSAPGPLPQQAEVVWTERGNGSPHEVTGVYLRGTTE